MLKKICRLFLGLVACMGSACVTPTHASSALSPDVVLTHIQSASPKRTKDEMVSIYNNTPNEINITNWCLKNKSVEFACFKTGNPSLAYYLPAYSFAVVVTESFLEFNSFSPEIATVIFTVTNQGNGSIITSNDSISLLDTDKSVIDTFAWTSASPIPEGQIAVRSRSIAVPYLYETSELTNNWSYGILTEMPVNQAELWGVSFTDDNENPDNTTPDDNTSDNADIPTENILSVVITELLPNAVGTDDGKEFIELFNPNSDAAIDLSNYKLRVGKQLEKSYSFPAGTVLEPLQYQAFTNNEIRFSLLNTTSSVQLEYLGMAIGDVITYVSPKDGQAWVLIDGVWMYTASPTPGAINSIPLVTNEGSVATTSVSNLKPCAANQYRNPATNRCKLIATKTSTLTPCKAGQYRNPETNRCRNIATAQSALKPCNEGQERNPETNRCRNIVKMTSANYGVKDATTQADGAATRWYWWLGIGGIIVSILGYATWEWREELQKVWRVLSLMLKQKFGRTKQ